MLKPGQSRRGYLISATLVPERNCTRKVQSKAIIPKNKNKSSNDKILEKTDGLKKCLGAEKVEGQMSRNEFLISHVLLEDVINYNEAIKTHQIL